MTTIYTDENDWLMIDSCDWFHDDREVVCKRW